MVEHGGKTTGCRRQAPSIQIKGTFAIVVLRDIGGKSAERDVGTDNAVVTDTLAGIVRPIQIANTYAPVCDLRVCVGAYPEIGDSGVTVGDRLNAVRIAEGGRGDGGPGEVAPQSGCGKGTGDLIVGGVRRACGGACRTICNGVDVKAV